MQIEKTLRQIAEHRFLSSLAISTPVILSTSEDPMTLSNWIHWMGATYFLSLALGIGKDYSTLLDDPSKRFPIRKDNTLLQNTSTLIRHNPLLMAIPVAIANFFYYKEFIRTGHRLIPIRDETYGMIGGLAGGLTTEVGIKTLFKHRKKTSRNWLEKTWNFFLEKPYSIGLAVATYNFVDNESPSLINFVGSAFVGAVATVATSLVGDVLHTENIRKNLRRTRRLFTKRSNLESLLQQEIELSYSPADRVKATVNLARNYRKTDQPSKSNETYRQAIRELESKDPRDFSYTYFIKQFFKGPIYRGMTNLVRRLKGIDSDSIDQVISDLVEGQEDAIERIRDIDEDQLDLADCYLYGKAYKLTGEKEKGRELQTRAVKQALETNKLIRLKETSRNPIYKLNIDSSLIEEVIVKQSKKEDLDLEQRVCLAQEQALKKYYRFSVPHPITTIEHQENSYYVMERETGNTLDSRIRNNTYTLTDLESISDFLTILHTTETVTPKPERDYTTHIVTQLEGITNTKITLTPILASISQIPRVPGQDPHPKNFQLNQDRITKLDTEQPKTVPATCELADLLDYTPGIPEDIKREIVLKYAQKAYPEISKKDFELAYLNSRILRALERFGPLHGVKDREDIQQYGIENSLQTINLIEAEFPEFYFTHEKDYKQLKRELERIPTTT